MKNKWKTKEKETWLWNLEVQIAMKVKKEAKKEWNLDPQSIARKDEYKKPRRRPKWRWKRQTTKPS